MRVLGPADFAPSGGASKCVLVSAGGHTVARGCVGSREQQRRGTFQQSWTCVLRICAIAAGFMLGTRSTTCTDQSTMQRVAEGLRPRTEGKSIGQAELRALHRISAGRSRPEKISAECVMHDSTADATLHHQPAPDQGCCRNERGKGAPLACHFPAFLSAQG